MATDTDRRAFLMKADENLASAASEFANGRYNACANRCYYACSQAAIAALIRAGIHPTSTAEALGHGFVQARFAGQLIMRRKLFLSGFADVLVRLLALREIADYRAAPVSSTQASRALRRATEFVSTIQS